MDLVDCLQRDTLPAQRGAGQLDQLAPERVARGEQKKGDQGDHAGLSQHAKQPEGARPEIFLDIKLGLLGALGQAGMVALITFFLLASGDTFRRKLVKLAGPTLSRKRVTLEAINEIHDQIQRYMLVNLFTSLVVGVVTWLSFTALGLNNAAVWGIAAGVLNLVPYIGAVLITGGSALVGFMQFGTLESALLVGAVSCVIHGVEGFLLTPWLTSRANQMNPVAIFIGVLAWGWLWGAWGLLLGVPVLVIVKAVCDRIEDLKPVGEILGR